MHSSLKNWQDDNAKRLYSAVLLLIAVAVVSAISLKLTADLQNGVRRTGESILLLEETSGDLRDAESAQRGYILSGGNEFLRLYRQAEQRWSELAPKLQATFAKDAVQSVLLRRLDAAATEKFTVMQTAIDIRNTQDRDAAAEYIGTLRGTRLMEEIREVITTMRRNEDNLLQRRSTFAAGAAVISFLVICGSAVGVAAYLYRVTRRVQEEIQQRTEAERLSRIAEDKLAVTLQSIGDGVIATDITGRVTLVNEVAEKLLEWTQQEAENRLVNDVFAVQGSGTGDTFPNPVLEAIRSNTIVDSETDTLVKTRSGRVLPVDDRATPIRDVHGNTIGGILIFRDMTERNQTRRDLEQANVRLRRAMSETHHRVKNNLQTIAALIEMQTLEVTGNIPVSALTRVHQQVISLAAIHDILTHEAKRQGDVQVIYTKNVLSKLRPLLAGVLGERSLHFDVEDVAVPIRQGTSLAVLVNELVSNSVKHGASRIDLSLKVCPAFAVPSEVCEIAGELFADNQPLTTKTDELPVAVLTVRDNGPGFPANFDPAVSANTGIELIKSLGQWDLNGVVRFANHESGGACVQIAFPIPPAPNEDGDITTAPILSEALVTPANAEPARFPA